jgi:hypothetical protein
MNVWLRKHIAGPSIISKSGRKREHHQLTLSASIETKNHPTERVEIIPQYPYIYYTKIDNRAMYAVAVLERSLCTTVCFDDLLACSARAKRETPE